MEEDPLSRLSLSNNAHWAVVAALRPLAPRLLVLGGGGYNPWSVGRLWTGIWAVLAGHEIPDRLPAEAEAVLRGLRLAGAGAARRRRSTGSPRCATRPARARCGADLARRLTALEARAAAWV